MTAQDHLAQGHGAQGRGAHSADDDPATVVIPRYAEDAGAGPRPAAAPGAASPSRAEPSPEAQAAAPGAPHLALLRRGPVVGTAAAIVAVLALAHYGAAVYGIGRPGFEIPAPIRLGTELNISTWFSSAMHLTNAALLALIAANSVRRERWRWILLSLSCAVVAMDETAANHEQVGWIIHTTFGTSGFLTYAWIIPAVVLVAVVAALCLPMVLRRPGAWLVVAGAAVFLLGAVGLESAGGALFEQTGDVQSFAYNVLAGTEETFEMAGLVIAMAGLLRMAGGSGLRIAGAGFVDRSR
ncbi:hypothetical protein [Pseudonocardia alni]|uniref:Uncharacterized protein n=2 Tax=Pseudonocardia TaxID=1847 RepID=A0A852WB48_PSEA5|nr:hypothetical protein [Pseudonocardia antarctica]NYG03036.1 hypothetical protein [Pseudonocardia antarctica]OJG06183.1 hypothetical protein BG618_02504 [Pseudonocardia autotrophica]